MAPNANLTLTVSNGELVGTRLGKVRFRVRAQDVRGLFYDTSPHRPIYGWLDKTAGAGLEVSQTGTAIVVGGVAAPLAALVFAVGLLGAVVLAPVKTTHHHVGVVWIGDGEPRDVVLQVGRKDYRSILDRLSVLSGRPWTDLPGSRREIVRRLEAGEGERVEVSLDRNVRLPDGALKRGRYQVVALPRAEGISDVFFFSGHKVEVKALKGSTVATVAGSEGTTESAVTYGAEGNVPTIETVRAGTRNYELARLSPAEHGARMTTVAGLPAKRFDADRGLAATVVRVTRGDEPAVRVAVAYIDGVTRGYLYLTPKRLIYDPSIQGAPFPLPAKHAKEWSRSEIVALAVEPTAGSFHLVSHRAGEKDRFRPLFEGKGHSNVLNRMSKEQREPERLAVEWLVTCWNGIDACLASMESP